MSLLEPVKDHLHRLEKRERSTHSNAMARAIVVDRVEGKERG
jgi:hypothetical protein